MGFNIDNTLPRDVYNVHRKGTRNIQKYIDFVVSQFIVFNFPFGQLRVYVFLLCDQSLPTMYNKQVDSDGIILNERLHIFETSRHGLLLCTVLLVVAGSLCHGYPDPFQILVRVSIETKPQLQQKAGLFDSARTLGVLLESWCCKLKLASLNELCLLKL